MSHIPEISDDVADPGVRAVFESQKEEYGFIFNTSRIYAHRPSIMRGHAALSEGISQSGLLDDSLKAIVCARVATINGCPF